jgi:ferredoxin-NADP reductase
MLKTRMRDTAFKRNLKNIPLGTKVQVSAPMGSFTLHKNAEKPALFIAGGIGITPIHSIVVDALERKLPHELFLFHSNRTPAATTFLAEFKSLAAEHKNFHFIPTITDLPSQISPNETWEGEHGKIDAPMIRKHVPALSSQTSNLAPITYIVGPPAMVSAMLPIAEEAGIDPDNIRTEEFAGY